MTSGSQQQKTLLFIVNVDWFFISHRLPIALQAIKEGYQVHLACAITDQKQYLEEQGITVHPLPLHRSSSTPLGESKAFLAIFKLIRQLNPRIVHSVTIKPVLYGGIVARLLNPPQKVFSISGLGFVFTSQGFVSVLRRLVVAGLYKLALGGKASDIIVQNNSDEQTLKDIKALQNNRITLIKGSGINLENYPSTPEPQGKPVILLVARLLKDKGVLEFAQAAKILQRKGIDARMCLVGDLDPENPNSLTSEELQKLRTLKNIELWGYRNDIPQVMAAANIITLPSYREGLPKCLIEAAASQRAIVTTNVPGCRDAIIPNKTGVLVPPRNPSALAEAIEQLITNTKLRSEMAQHGREWATNAFNIKDVIDTHMNIYNVPKTIN
jgi:glycosyltransferase involved in cell wall biosynthesis